MDLLRNQRELHGDESTLAFASAAMAARAALTLTAVAAVIHVCAAAPARRTELTFEVQPQREEVFYEDVSAVGATLDVSVLVFRGGKLDLRLRIQAPSGDVVYDQLLFSNLDERGRMLPTIVKKGHSFAASSVGRYQISIDNRIAKWTAKHGTLEVEVRDPAGGDGDGGGGGGVVGGGVVGGGGGGGGNVSATTDTMRLTTRRMLGTLDSIRNAQLYHAHREARHRNTLESTNARVLQWSAAETVAILSAVGVLQAVIRVWFKRPALLPGKA